MASSEVRGQEPAAPLPRANSVAVGAWVYGGAGSLSAEYARDVMPWLSARVQGDRWAHGMAPCEAKVPSACSGEGWQASAGARAQTGWHLVRVYAEAAGGMLFLRRTHGADGDFPTLEAGGGVALEGDRLLVRFGTRQVAVFSDPWESVFDERLRYPVWGLVLGFRF